MAIVFIVIIYCILCISSGENMVEGIWGLTGIALSISLGIYLKIDEERSKKDAANKIQKWEEYKRKNYGKM